MLYVFLKRTDNERGRGTFLQTLLEVCYYAKLGYKIRIYIVLLLQFQLNGNQMKATYQITKASLLL